MTEGHHQRECILQYADSVVDIPGGDVDAVGGVQTDDAIEKACGEVTMMTRRAGVDAADGLTGLLPQIIVKLVNEEMGTKEPPLARAV